MVTVEEIPVGQIAGFWDRHIRYLTEDNIVTEEEEIAYFQSAEYRDTLKNHMLRKPDTHHMAYFVEGNQRIGAVQYTTFQSEDGKCFILDFWVFPAFRGNGTGHRCFLALQAHTRADGAAYFALNCEREPAQRFWRSLGFVDDGIDAYGMPLMVKR